VTREVYLTARAESQLRNAARWWANHRSAAQAERWYAGFLEALDSLANAAEEWPLAPENADFPFPLRQLLYGLSSKKTHRALFTVRPDRIVVYSIRHLSQKAVTPDDV
jgi:plasmid stabilization system protein ParE